MTNDGGDEMASSLSSSRVKFLCSHGGKIFPRAVDGNLKYVGGETRVVAFPRDIKFSELMKKLTNTAMISDGDVVLKYQLIPEDFDTLVSVRTDEDLKHMFDEYDRQGSEGAPKLRTFLFPSIPVVIDNQTGPVDSQAIEQHYIDAINGIVRTTGNGRVTPINANRASFSISSPCTSPKSTTPESITVETIPHEFVAMDGYQNSQVTTMHKVKSSPTLCSLNNHNPVQNSSSPSNHLMYQHPRHHYYQQHLPLSYQTYRSPSPMTLGGQPDFARAPIAHSPNSYTRSHSSRSHFATGAITNKGTTRSQAYGLRRDNSTESLPHYQGRS